MACLNRTLFFQKIRHTTYFPNTWTTRTTITIRAATGVKWFETLSSAGLCLFITTLMGRIVSSLIDLSDKMSIWVHFLLILLKPFLIRKLYGWVWRDGKRILVWSSKRSHRLTLMCITWNLSKASGKKNVCLHLPHERMNSYYWSIASCWSPVGFSPDYQFQELSLGDGCVNVSCISCERVWA